MMVIDLQDLSRIKIKLDMWRHMMSALQAVPAPVEVEVLFAMAVQIGGGGQARP